jgi:hypothetical protein
MKITSSKSAPAQATVAYLPQKAVQKKGDADQTKQCHRRTLGAKAGVAHAIDARANRSMHNSNA